MSKEIEALERLYCSGNLQLNYVLSNKHKQDYETVEQALQRLESIDNSNPSEALRGLSFMGERRIEFSEFSMTFKDTREYKTIKNYILKAQEKHLKDKAFELIILKNVDVKEIRPNATAEAYNSKIPYYRRPLTDDEFKFLKEMVHRLDCEEILFELPKVY